MYQDNVVMGKNLVEDFITKDFQKSVNNVLRKALTGEETSNFEFPLITKDERRIEVLLNATPRYDARGTVIGVVGIGQVGDLVAQEETTHSND